MTLFRYVLLSFDTHYLHFHYYSVQGMVLGFIGAEPTLDGTGRIARFDLIPLAELARPRVDVVCNLSGIFRDSFEHVVHLLDDMFARAAALGQTEGFEMNYVAKHARDIEQNSTGENGHVRLFSNPPGDFGSMVNERVASSNWSSGDELSETYVSRNSFMYGRGGKAGRKDESGIFRKMLSTTSRVVQCIDSVEYGLSDIQEYYANTGRSYGICFRMHARREAFCCEMHFWHSFVSDHFQVLLGYMMFMIAFRCSCACCSSRKRL